MKGIFITGTDTNIGKTITASILANFLAKNNKFVHYHKPIQTGQELDIDMIKKLNINIRNLTCSNFIKLKKPLSPHIACYYENTNINFFSVVKNIKNIKNIKNYNNNYLIIEGAGGLLVPITPTKFIIDLIENINLPTVIVSKNILGAINHTLLTVRALREKKIPILGIVLVGDKNIENKNSIIYYSKINNILQIPIFDKLNSLNIDYFTQKNQDILSKFLQV